MEQQKKRTLYCVLALLAALVCGGILFYFGVNGEVVTEVRFEREIRVNGGVAETEGALFDVTVEKDGAYRLNAEWTTAPGLLTGVRLVDADGNTAFFATAESTKTESDPLSLHAGQYTMAFASLTNPASFRVFASKAGMAQENTGRITDAAGEISSIDDYPFQTDGTWQLKCEYALTRVGPLSTRAAGVLTGAVFGFVLAGVIVTGARGNGAGKRQYDERQQVARGKGYRNGFWTAFGYMTLWLLIGVMDISIPVEASVIAFIGMMVAGYVFVVTCIHTDAYFALNENRKRTSLCLLFIGIGNIGIGIASLISGRTMENGILTFRSINLICGIFLAAIGVAVFIRKLRADREEDAE